MKHRYLMAYLTSQMFSKVYNKHFLIFSMNFHAMLKVLDHTVQLWATRLSHYTPAGNKNLRVFLLPSWPVCLVCAVNQELSSSTVNLMQIITKLRSQRGWVEHCEVVAVFLKWLWECKLVTCVSIEWSILHKFLLLWEWINAKNGLLDGSKCHLPGICLKVMIYLISKVNFTHFCPFWTLGNFYHKNKELYLYEYWWKVGHNVLLCPEKIPDESGWNWRCFPIGV